MLNKRVAGVLMLPLLGAMLRDHRRAQQHLSPTDASQWTLGLDFAKGRVWVAPVRKM